MKRWLGLLVLFASFASPTPLWAFERETTDDPDCTEALGVNCVHQGVPLVWDAFPVAFAINSAGSGLDFSSVAGAVQASFDSWRSASSDHVTFTFDGSTTAGSDGQDGQNTVSWRNLGSNAADTFAQSVLTYDKGTGRIFDVDIELNSVNVFAILPEGEDNNFDSRVDVQAVVTHEVGHLLGLAHENRFGPQVVMFFSDTSGNTTHRTLTSDDRDGVRAIYAAGSGSGGGSSSGGGGGGCSIAPGSSGDQVLPVLLLISALLVRERLRRRRS